MSKTLLVVDDHKLITQLLILALKFNSDPFLQVVGNAEDGTTALRLCAELRPDLVMLDIFLPDQSGIEIGKQMLSFERSPKVVFYSASEQAAFIKEALMMGASGYLLKHTAGIEDLLAALKFVCNGGKVFPPDLLEQVSASLPYQDLTSRQVQAFALKAAGYSNEQVAVRLGISPKTLETLLSSAYTALGVTNGMQAIYVLSKRGII